MPLSTSVQAAADQIVQGGRSELQKFAGRRVGCGPDARQAEAALAQQVELFVDQLVRQQRARWNAVRPSLDSAGACVMHCGLCDGTGWAGRVQCVRAVTADGPYRNDETQTWFIGGTPTVNGPTAAYTGGIAILPDASIKPLLPG